MKNIERKNVIKSIATNRTVQPQNHITQLGKVSNQSSLLPKAKVFALQNELKGSFNFQICKNSIQYLSLYCEYLKKLKQLITSQSKDSFQQHSYLAQFRRSHPEEHMSKIFMGIDSTNKKLKRENMQFSKLCLISYFQLQQFHQDSIIAFLSKKIGQAKANRMIDYEEGRSDNSKKSFIHYQQKQNKLKTILISQSRKTIGQKVNKINFQILALKVILGGGHPDPMQTNKICQKIKADLQNLFKRIKLKPILFEPNFRKKGAPKYNR